jgi:hypothetical protein
MKTKKTTQNIPKEIQKETPKEVPAQPPLREANVTFATDFKTVYTNFIQGQFSPFDMSFLIAEALGPGPDGRPMILQKVRITMAPMEAKILLMIIADGLKKYEDQFGKISIPPEAMPTGGV